MTPTTPTREVIIALLEAPDMDTAASMLDALLTNISNAARRGIGGNAPPEPITAETVKVDPEDLVRIEMSALDPLLRSQYAGLLERNRELAQDAARWMDDHQGGRRLIANDAECDALADQMRQMDDHLRELDETRKKVSTPLHEAWKASLAWFANFADPLMRIRGAGKAPAPATMQFMQTAYLVAKANRERAERERLAREAAAEAQRLREAAECAIAEEQARIAQLGSTGTSHEEATGIVTAHTDALIGRSGQADQYAQIVAQAAEAPAREFARTRSALGTTTTLSTQWDARLNPDPEKGIKLLCRAVADGHAPITFVLADMAAVRQAIRRKQSPLRDCPGLIIEETFAARRTGG
jgi:hypothetical protein